MAVLLLQLVEVNSALC